MDIKDELYAILSSADGYVSGQKIAGTLGVSRNAVWKAAEALKSEGCMIEAVRNRGYALIKESGVLSARRISDGLRGNAAKCRIITLGEVESTNTYLKKLAADGESFTVNLGTGKGTSVKEIVDATEKVIGRKLNYDYATRRAGDPAILTAKADKARQLLGWEPQYTDIEEIIRTVWNLEQ